MARMEITNLGQLAGVACGQRPLSQAEGLALEWALSQLAMESTEATGAVMNSYETSIAAGADWYGAIAAAFLQTPREWGAGIQAAIYFYRDILEEYNQSEEAAFRFADRIVVERSQEKPLFAGFVPMSAGRDERTIQFLRLAEETNIAGETVELVKVLEDRNQALLKTPHQCSFEGLLAAFFCDLGIDPAKVPQLLSFAALISIVFRPTPNRNL